jgi:hypothetical protein
LGEKDMDRLEAELKAAAGHPLEPRYRGYMESLPELAAERAWRPIEPYTRQEKFTLPSAAAAIRLLRAFEQQHGETEFARSVENKAKELRKRAEPALEIVVDNNDQGVKVLPDVNAWGATNYRSGGYNDYYLHDKNELKGHKSVRYTPSIKEAGHYYVYIWYPTATRPGAPNMIYSSNTPVDIIHKNGRTTITVNQNNNCGRWVQLGTQPYEFEKGTGNSVLIRTTGTTAHVTADAVKWILRP